MTLARITSLITLLVLVGSVHAQELSTASWTVHSPDDVKAKLEEFVASQDVDEKKKAALKELWEFGDADILQRASEILAVFDEDTANLLAHCQQTEELPIIGDFPYLSEEAHAAVVRNNGRLLYGRWLAQNNYYDEALAQLDGLKAADVVDPASLLFYQAISQHHLLKKDECLKAVDRLLENEDELPRRFATVAKLMEADLKPLKKDSLNEVARLMNDIERRLGFGRAGKVVRDEEDEVIKKLDDMIEELEKQRQQQQQQGQSGGSSPSTPMQDSVPGGGSGPGEVLPTKVGDSSGWGNLPPQKRKEAMQQISKELPSHYREVIEEYFRKIARDGR